MPPKGNPNPLKGPSQPFPTNDKRKASQNLQAPPPKRFQRNPIQIAREIHSQRTSALPKDSGTGSINLATFLSTREYEIKALEDGMARSKGVLSRRAFQQVPHELRRRTASHNVKRVPARLRQRAKREMKEDNTPTVKQGAKKGSTRSRIRAETAKRLGLLAGKKKAAKAKDKGNVMADGLTGRVPMPKLKKGTLMVPPKPKSKFRKRQIHKTWLPTHLWHTKRAKMTEPKNPFWRFAIPLSPTEKSYRPTHRAGGARGAVCWDMSYMSTIGLEGSDLALEKVLRCCGVTDDKAWGKFGAKWRLGKRSWTGWTSRDIAGQKRIIGPATVIWQNSSVNADAEMSTEEMDSAKSKKEKVKKRHVVIRIHPSAFLELWTEVLRISKQQRPLVSVLDLRFEIGSIDITGPGSLEALLGILKPMNDADEHGTLFRALAGVSNAASLPLNALLSFSIMDPRLRYPPRKHPLPDVNNANATFALLKNLSEWPADLAQPSQSFWDRKAIYKATRLPSQKAINRRKALAAPGEFPKLCELDPDIPIMILASRCASSASAQGTFTLLAPWKCILPIWYGLVHYPLSTGGNPRHGGLQELQQLAFEHGEPWFPADYLGTQAGWTWEQDQQSARKREWERRPRGKRTAYESLDLGFGRKGEIGNPWGCDFERLLQGPAYNDSQTMEVSAKQQSPSEEGNTGATESPVIQLSKSAFSSILDTPPQEVMPKAVATIKLTLLSKGVPQPAARIYRLPSDNPQVEDNSIPLHESEVSTESANSTSQKALSLPHDLRQQWLALIPPPTTRKALKSKDFTSRGLKAVPIARKSDMTLEQRKVAIARELFEKPALPYPKEKEESQHPPIPAEEDLIGFVTTGNFNLAHGQGTAIGTVLISKVIRLQGTALEKRLCIVRNVGESTGRLARWEVV